jgi:orotate phosphoribosyltransferase-like protein
MSMMKDLSYDIQELYIEGFNSRAIADELNCPIEIVLGALKEMNVEDEQLWIGDPFATINS